MLTTLGNQKYKKKESWKKIKEQKKIQNFFLLNQYLKLTKVWKYGFIKKDEFELHLRMTNKTLQNCSCIASGRDLVRIFFSHLVGSGSHSDHSRKVGVFWFQCSYRPSSKHDPGCCLQGALARWLAAWNLVRVWSEHDFSTFAKFLRALCGQMSQLVSE